MIQYLLIILLLSLSSVIDMTYQLFCMHVVIYDTHIVSSLMSCQGIYYNNLQIYFDLWSLFFCETHKSVLVS
jgi:hypothetical protein